MSAIEQLQIIPVRKCPNCLTLRPETGGAFCTNWCEREYLKNGQATALLSRPPSRRSE